MAGPVVGSPAAASVAPKSFKQPFKAVAQLSSKTGQITKPIDPAISKSLDFLYKGVEVRKKHVSVCVCLMCLCRCLCPSAFAASPSSALRASSYVDARACALESMRAAARRYAQH